MTELGVNLPSLIAYVVNFVILLGILYLLAYKPIIRLLDQRADRIRESLSAADEARQEATSARSAIDEQINEARREGQRLLDQSRTRTPLGIYSVAANAAADHGSPHVWFDPERP